MIDREFIKGSTIFGIGYALARVFGLLFFIIVARICTPEDYGFVRYCIAVASIAGVPIISQSTTLARYLGKYNGRRKEQNIYFSNTLFSVFITLSSVVIILFSILYITDRLYIGIFFVVIGSTISEIYYGLLRGFILYMKLALFLVSTNIIKIALILIIFYMKLHQPQIILAIFGLSCVISMLIIELKHSSPVSFRVKEISMEILREIYKFCIPIIVASYAYTLITSFDTICIEHYLGMYEVGIYSVAKALGQIFVFVPLTINTFLMPKVAGFDEHEIIMKYLKLSLSIVISTSSVLLLCIYMFQREIIEIIFTAKYLDAVTVLCIYSVGMVFYAIYSTISNVLIGIGMPRFYMSTSLVCAIINVLGNLYALPRWGIYGAGIIFMFSYLIASLLIFILVLKTWLSEREEREKLSVKRR